MSPLTEEQTNAINDTFWGDEQPACPVCGVHLRITVSDELGFPKDMLVVCPGCGLDEAMRAAPEAGGELEKKAVHEMVGLFLRGALPTCPLDGTGLEIEESGVLDGKNTTHYFLWCPRCGAKGEMKWSPDASNDE